METTQGAEALCPKDYGKAVKMRKITGIFMVAALVVTWLGIGLTAEKELTADQVMEKVRENRYPETSRSEIRMTLIDPDGGKLVKDFMMYRKVMDNDAKTFIVFRDPPSIRGTRFLVLQKGDEEDTFAKFAENPTVQRIGESQRTDRFMGSDFTYGDLEIEKEGEDNFEKLGQQKYKEIPCYVIKSTPKNLKKAQYSHLKLWIDKEKFVSRFTEFYSKKKPNEKIKTLEVNEVKLIQDKWTATNSVMTDLRDNHKTVMELIKVKFNVPIDDGMFSIRTLIRGI